MSNIEILKSKIHRATVTDSNLNYEGSITIDEALIEAAALREWERVQVLNVNTGARFDTYVIKGARNSGDICLNGAAARLVQKGDIVIILSYWSVQISEADTLTPVIINPNSKNQVL